MQTHTEKKAETRSNAIANGLAEAGIRKNEPNSQFIDNRPEAVAQKKVQEIAYQYSTAIILNKQNQKKESLAEKTPAIQRVKTPTLYDTIGFGFWENKEKLKPVFKQTLILLRSQLKLSTPADLTEKNACLAEVDRLVNEINNDHEIEQSVMKAIIERVNNLAPGTASQPTQAEALKLDEEDKFDTLADTAAERIDAATNDKPALEATFTGKNLQNEKDLSTNKAKTNYSAIKDHILKWKNEKAAKVRINRANANYGAYNTGTGDASKLMLSNKTFTDPAKDVAGTVIHEASHGSIQTKDHAYMNAPYFLRLPDEHRLDNADHYKYAPQVAKKESDPAAIGLQGGGDPPLIKDFKQAKDLAFYKANKIWTYLMWMKDTYGGKKYLDQNTLDKHSEWLGLQDRPSKAIHKENVQLLIDMYSYLKSYIAMEMEVLPGVENGAVKMKPGNGGREIEIKALVGKSVDQMSGAILDAYFDLLGLPPDWNINRIGMNLFDRIFIQEADTIAANPGNKASPLEKDLYRLLGGEGI